MTPHRNLVIIGSGPAGLTAALYAARANLKPLLIEGLEAGGQLMLTTMVENFPGFRDGIMGPELMADMRAQAERFGTEIIQGNVSKIEVNRCPIKIEVSDQIVYAESLIIATGASARLLGLPSERTLLGHGVSTCATCDGFFFRGKPIAVVGGGDSAMEEAIFLTKFASKVTVVHRRDTLRASKIMQEKAFAQSQDRVRLEQRSRRHPRRLERGRHGDRAARQRHRSAHELPVEGVFVAIGHTPNTELVQGAARAGRERLHRHASRHAHQHPGRIRGGDVQDHIYRQAITAAGTGCMAAIDAERYLDRVPADAAEAQNLESKIWNLEPESRILGRTWSRNPEPL